MDAKNTLNENELSKIILEVALRVHQKLGPGLLENAYRECLVYELKKQGLKIEKGKALPLTYDDVRLDVGYRVDILVQDMVVIEVKSGDGLDSIHLAQVLNYLKLSNCKLGLLINFNVLLLKNGFKRVVNGL